MNAPAADLHRFLLLPHAPALVERHDHRHGRDGLLERRDLLLDAVFEDDQIARVELDGAAVGVARNELERRLDRRRRGGKVALARLER